jgi:hypothetical protein
MLYQGNGNESVDGVYERERLRRMAKKLGLRLVKPRGQRSEETMQSATDGPGAPPRTQLDGQPELETKFDKCG